MHENELLLPCLPIHIELHPLHLGSRILLQEGGLKVVFQELNHPVIQARLKNKNLLPQISQFRHNAETIARLALDITFLAEINGP